jgi:hypothetical protein
VRVVVYMEGGGRSRTCYKGFHSISLQYCVKRLDCTASAEERKVYGVVARLKKVALLRSLGHVRWRLARDDDATTVGRQVPQPISF